MRLLLLFILSLSSIVLSYAQIINVSDFGVIPNTFEDATEGVRKAIAKCKEYPQSTLVFPSGRYDFWSENAEKREYYISNTSSETECPSKIKNIGLLFEGAENITIEGNNSLFMFHGKIITWAIDKCENIKIQNLSID